MLAALDPMEPRATSLRHVCTTCGFYVGTPFRFCPGCGTSAHADGNTERDMPAIAPPPMEPDPSSAATRLLAVGGGTRRGRSEALHHGIGVAIVRGDLDRATALYLGLAELLLRDGGTQAALTELDEAVLLVTLGEGAGAAAGPRALWRLLLLRASVLAGTDVPAARATALQAYHHAKRVGARSGCERAVRLLRRLSPAPTSRPRPPQSK